MKNLQGILSGKGALKIYELLIDTDNILWGTRDVYVWHEPNGRRLTETNW